MATIQQQIDAINAEIASGQETVRHGETSKTARPLADLLRIRADLERRKRTEDGTGATRRVNYLYQSGKGL